MPASASKTELAVAGAFFAPPVRRPHPRVVVARNFGQVVDFGAGVDREQGVGGGHLAAGGEVDRAAGFRRPFEPDRVAARVAGVVGLARFLGGPDGRAAGRDREPSQHPRSGEGVIRRAALRDFEREAPPGAAALVVDRDPVRGAFFGLEPDRAVRFPAAVGRIVVARDFGQVAEPAAGVDGEQGVGARFQVGTGRDRDRAVDRRRPRVPDGVAAGVAGVVRLFRLLGREHGRADGLGRQPGERFGVEKVVVRGRRFDAEVEFAFVPVLAVDGDHVSRVFGRVEGDFAAKGALRIGAGTVARDFGQVVEFGAGVDREQRIEAPLAAAGRDPYPHVFARGPGEPNRVAAGVAGVVRLFRLLGRQFVGRLREGGEAGTEHLRMREIVVGRAPPDPQAEPADRALRAVDRDPVRRPPYGVEGDFAVGRPAGKAFAARAVVVAGDFGEVAEFAAGVDREQGVEGTGGGASGDSRRFARRGRPFEPDRMAAGIAGVVGLFGLLGREPVGGEGHGFRGDGLRIGEVIVRRRPFQLQVEAPFGAVAAVDRDPVSGAGLGFEFRQRGFAEEAFGGERMAVVGDRSERVDRGAGVDGDEWLQGAEAGGGSDRDRTAGCRRPFEPDRVAARVAGVVGLPGLLGRFDVAAGGFGRERRRQRLGRAEVVVGRGGRSGARAQSEQHREDECESRESATRSPACSSQFSP